LNSPYLEKDYYNIKRKKNDDEDLNIVDGIISVIYRYAEVYRTHPILLDTKTLQMNLAGI
jgi:hypothetical protein